MTLSLLDTVVIVIEDGVAYKLISVGDVQGWEVSIYYASKIGVSFFTVDTKEFGAHKFHKPFPTKTSTKEVVESIEEGLKGFQIDKAIEQFTVFCQYQKAHGLYVGVS